MSNPTNGHASKPKFSLGQVFSTPGAVEALEESGQSAGEFFNRHIIGDWGEVCPEDKEANEQSLLDGSRLLSAYRTNRGKKLWVFSEAVDDTGRRAATTMLLPDEY